MKQKSAGFLLFFINNWWVIAFLLAVFVVYFQASQKKKDQLLELRKVTLMLQKEKKQIIKENEELTLRIMSQNDPNWIELMLIEKLGVVPEGQIKVVFKGEPE